MNEKALGEPLTLEQLSGMDGKPVWAKLLKKTRGQSEGYAIVYKDNGSAAVQRWTAWTLWYSEHGVTWIAYACPAARLNREAWEPCEHCKPSEYPPDYYGPHNFTLVGAEIYYYDTDDGWEGEDINFCPWCGRPLTDEAVKEFERRVYGG